MNCTGQDYDLIHYLEDRGKILGHSDLDQMGYQQ